MKAGFTRLAAAVMLFSGAAALADPARDLKRGNIAYDRGDVVDAMNHYRRAARQGYAPAQVRLAYILDAAEFNAEAVEWYRRAAEAGDPEGLYGLGQMYLKGEGIERDRDQGRDWIVRAAEAGLTSAMRVLATNYERGGMGLDPDPELARHWLERAAAQGDEVARQRLERLDEAPAQGQ